MRQLGRHHSISDHLFSHRGAGCMVPMGARKSGRSNRGRKADPDREGRTAWGLGGAAPASLDVYGQSRIAGST
jgi:hypothetical protein